jgi:mannose-1-phosphate guanylyltransferase
MEKDSIIHVILTGGVGSRFGRSRKSQPSNILIFFDGKSLFEMTVDRNKNIAGQGWLLKY